jgi:hypothetical protein
MPPPVAEPDPDPALGAEPLERPGIEMPGRFATGVETFGVETLGEVTLGTLTFGVDAGGVLTLGVDALGTLGTLAFGTGGVLTFGGVTFGGMTGGVFTAGAAGAFGAGALGSGGTWTPRGPVGPLGTLGTWTGSCAAAWTANVNIVSSAVATPMQAQERAASCLPCDSIRFRLEPGRVVLRPLPTGYLDYSLIGGDLKPPRRAGSGQMRALLTA